MKFLYGNGNHPIQQIVDYSLSLLEQFITIADIRNIYNYGLYQERELKQAENMERELGIDFVYRSIAVLTDRIRVFV